MQYKLGTCIPVDVYVANLNETPTIVVKEQKSNSNTLHI